MQMKTTKRRTRTNLHKTRDVLTFRQLSGVTPANERLKLAGKHKVLSVNALRSRRYLDPKHSRWMSADPALQDYIPLAPTDDEAKRHNENLPAGGIYNPFNFALYTYTSNNPIKYIDPNGEFTFNVGLYGHGGAGSGGGGSVGIVVGYSKEQGFTFGVYSSESMGAEFGIDLSAGVEFGIDIKSKGVETGNSMSANVGGSFTPEVGPTIGADVTVDLDSKEVGATVGGSKGRNFKLGVGVKPSVGEGHVRVTATQTRQITGNDVKNVGDKVKGFFKGLFGGDSKPPQPTNSEPNRQVEQ